MLTVRERMESLLLEHSMRNMLNVSRSYGDAIAMEYTENGQIKKMTYKEFGRMVDIVAHNLRSITGKTTGRFIGLKLPNEPYWAICFWAIFKSGNNALLLDNRGSEQTISHLLNQAGAVVIITRDDIKVPDNVAVIKVQELLAPVEVPAESDGEWGDLMAFCTSGTTATSRVFVYDGKAIMQQLISAITLTKKTDRLVRDNVIERSLAFLPMHHIFGFLVPYYLTAMMGNTVIFPPDMVPEHVLETCRKQRVTQFICVPMFFNGVVSKLIKKAKQMGEDQYNRLVKGVSLSLKLQKGMRRKGQWLASNFIFKKLQQNLFGTDIHLMISGGGHILPETLRIMNGIGYYLVNGYGMTEIGIISVVNTESVEKRINGSVGRPYGSAEARIEPFSPGGDVGELWCRGKGFHIGEMVNGKFVPRDMSNGGWFATGDIARIERGYIWLEGRIKDVIVNESGENIFPDEIEDSFMDLPGVKQFSVLGLRGNNMYEAVSLIVEKDAESAVDDTALWKAVSQRSAALPPDKRIRRLLVSNEPLPLANGIKVQRLKLKEAIEKGRWDYYEVNIASGAVSGKEAPKAEAHAETPEEHRALFEKIKEEVKDIFAEVLVIDRNEIGDKAHFIDELGGDSLSSLAVFTKAEEKYGVMISDGEYLSCASAHDLAALIVSKLTGATIDGEHKPGQRKRITTFEESREFRDFAARLKANEEILSEYGNPYFVAHDSPLLGTSIMDGREVINFGSYNYLGFSGDPETKKAAKEAVDKYGTSASGSRLLAGEKSIHKELEAAIARWKHTEDAIVLVGGHSTNVTFIGNFCNKNDLILYDALSHNSIMQGCALSPADTKAFPHNDINTLAQILKQNRDNYEKVLIVVEGVYSMDGDIAPIPEFVRIKKEFGCFLMVDEAHSSCVIGNRGGGVDDYFNLQPDDVDIKMGTLSKGLGTCGGYIAGKKSMVEYLRYNVPGFVFSVGISPPLAAASKRAIEIMEQDDSRVKRLHRNIADFISEAKKRGMDTCLAKETAIVPIVIGADRDAFRLSMLMLRNGVFVPPAVYPAVPRNSARLRFCLTSEHTHEQIVYAIDLLDRLMKNGNQEG